MDDSSGAVKKFIAKMGVNYLIVMGTKTVADQYQVKGYPLTFYIDRYGRITDQVPGLATRGYMENEIKLALMNRVPRREIILLSSVDALLNFSESALVPGCRLEYLGIRIKINPGKPEGSNGRNLCAGRRSGIGVL